MRVVSFDVFLPISHVQFIKLKADGLVLPKNDKMLKNKIFGKTTPSNFSHEFKEINIKLYAKLKIGDAWEWLTPARCST